LPGSSSSIRYVEGVVEPVAELARLLRTADWVAGRSDAEIGRALAGSTLVVTAWDGDRCVGILRVISDGVFRALIEDVVIEFERRGQGIGRALVEFALSRPAVLEVEELILFTGVPEFWGRFGFEPVGSAMKRFRAQTT
jgi:GNAT superfamily N-acetyltransferase